MVGGGVGCGEWGEGDDAVAGCGDGEFQRGGVVVVCLAGELEEGGGVWRDPGDVDAVKGVVGQGLAFLSILLW